MIRNPVLRSRADTPLIIETRAELVEALARAGYDLDEIAAVFMCHRALLAAFIREAMPQINIVSPEGGRSWMT